MIDPAKINIAENRVQDIVRTWLASGDVYFILDSNGVTVTNKEPTIISDLKYVELAKNAEFMDLLMLPFEEAAEKDIKVQIVKYSKEKGA
jgi:hypothetical protein